MPNPSILIKNKKFGIKNQQKDTYVKIKDEHYRLTYALFGALQIPVKQKQS